MNDELTCILRSACYRKLGMKNDCSELKSDQCLYPDSWSIKKRREFWSLIDYGEKKNMKWRGACFLKVILLFLRLLVLSRHCLEWIMRIEVAFVKLMRKQ